MQIDIASELIILIKLVVSFLLGAFIGLDRERHGRDAGIRTYGAVCVGATLFTAVTMHLADDPTAASRVIANIIASVSSGPASFTGMGLREHHRALPRLPWCGAHRPSGWRLR